MFGSRSVFGPRGPFGRHGMFGPHGPFGRTGPLGPDGLLGRRGPLAAFGAVGGRGFGRYGMVGRRHPFRLRRMYRRRTFGRTLQILVGVAIVMVVIALLGRHDDSNSQWI